MEIYFFETESFSQPILTRCSFSGAVEMGYWTKMS